MDDVETIRERAVDAEGLASYLHRNQGANEIRRALDDVPRVLELIAELRAVLAPRLDNPIEFVGQPPTNMCIFCRAEHEWNEPTHDADCPVLRKDELLGRLTESSI